MPPCQRSRGPQVRPARCSGESVSVAACPWTASPACSPKISACQRHALARMPNMALCWKVIVSLSGFYGSFKSGHVFCIETMPRHTECLWMSHVCLFVALSPAALTIWSFLEECSCSFPTLHLHIVKWELWLSSGDVTLELAKILVSI